MNILLVNMSIDLKLGGGTAERICQLTKALNKLPDTQAKALSTTTGLKEELPLDTEHCILLPCLNDRWYVPAPFFIKLYQVVKWADIIVITGHWTLLNAMVYIVNKFVGRPFLFNPAGALHVFGRSGIFKRVYQVLVGKGMLKNAARMIAIPKEEKDFFCELGIEKNKVVVIPNGISMNDFSYCGDEHFRHKYQLPDEPFILFMGRLNEIKGPDILLEAFVQVVKLYPNVHLVMAGPDGGMYGVLQATVEKLNLSDKVHFIGYITGQEKSVAYHAAELLVVPSRLEAMSIVALESAACGTPVVMTNVCGFSELVEAGGALETGVDEVEMKDAIVILLNDRVKAKGMGNKAKKLIYSEYTWDIAAIKHREVCKEVMQESI